MHAKLENGFLVNNDVQHTIPDEMLVIFERPIQVEKPIDIMLLDHSVINCFWIEIEKEEIFIVMDSL